MLISADGDRARVHIKVGAKEDSSAWLQIIPESSLGLRLGGEVVCVATGLRLVLSLCTSLICQH